MAHESEEATKARVIHHMNNDHSESISLFLRHFSQISEQNAKGASIDDISLYHIQIKTLDERSHSIPIEPPMGSWAEVRERIKEMDSIVRKALGVSNIRLNTYKPPTPPLHMVIFGLCFSIYISSGLLNWGASTVPGIILSHNLNKWFPGGAERFRSLMNKSTLALFTIHAAEVWYLDRSRLKIYGIKKNTGLWWCWVLSCMIEGVGSFRRLDAEVKRIKMKIKMEYESAKN